MKPSAGTGNTSSAEPNLASEITRTFTPFRESKSEETDYEYWFRQALGHHTTWSDLMKERLVVIVGEAGIGKTYEFRQQSRRLRAQGNAAFFIPLNLLQQPEDWDVALGEQAHDFRKWAASSNPGTFFLDAVDEARLTGPTALQRSLVCVRQSLAGHIDRVSFCVSSRISDWSLPPVRALIAQQLFLRKSPPDWAAASVGDAVTAPLDDAGVVTLSVYSLDPLSTPAAKQLAASFGVTTIDAFWNEVEDGDYEFLASRPLDLQWMSTRWRDSGRLGSFADLIESAVTNRLVEKNQAYVDAGAVLSRDQLRRGVEALAAACVFSGSAYVQVEPGEASTGAIAPSSVLSDWTAMECQRLLGSAVFDEATYGRVQFHHRSVREYLAACWVKRQLDLGLPFARAWQLFARSPYGEEVLVPSRRASLCWLASLDAKARGHVIRAFPEMVIFEGDPQRWSSDDVVEAFERVIDKLSAGFQPDWWNFASEFRRTNRMIPPKVLSGWLDKYRVDSNVMSKLLMLVKHGRAGECAEQVFSLYRSAESAEGLRLRALSTLQTVASSVHRDAITEDIFSDRLAGNELIAEGIKTIGIAHLTAKQLEGCFRKAEAERAFGGGPLAIAVKMDLLPEARLADVAKLLAALLSALPTTDWKDLTRRYESGEKREGWILSVLPDVLLKSLELASNFGFGDEQLAIDCALIVEKLRHTNFANDEDFRRLRVALAKFPELRKAVALRIAASDIPHGFSALTWMSGIVYFDHDDLPWLVACANATGEDVRNRAVWYRVARDIVVRSLRGTRRREVFGQLLSGPDEEERRKDLAELTSQRRAGLAQQRKWKHESIADKKETKRQDAANRNMLLKRIDEIRAGTAFDAIKWLVEMSAARSDRSQYTKVDIEVVRNVLGAEIAGAFKEGLTRAWRHIDAPDSQQYVDNRVPWTGLVGLASANHAFQSGMDIAGLAEDEVKKLVRLCVWELNQPEAWFTQLVESRTSVAGEALSEWFDFELALQQEEAPRRTIEMVLSGPLTLTEPTAKHLTGDQAAA